MFQGLYALHLPVWLAFFKLDVNLHIVDGDNMIERPWEELIKIQQFLGIQIELDEKDFVFSEQKGFYCMKPK